MSRGLSRRWRILARDNFTCQYCGQSAPDVRLEVDHIIARSLGGSNDDSNLVTACWDCNRGKSGRDSSISFEGQSLMRWLTEENDRLREWAHSLCRDLEPIWAEAD